MKYLYLTFAFICLISGCAGIVIPGLPTTPLLLAASFFFSKGSDRFHHWFIKTKLYRKQLEPFIQHKSMKLSTKIYILIFSTCSMGLSIYLINITYVRILTAIILTVQYFCFFFIIKTTPTHEILPFSQFQQKQRQKMKR